MTLSNPERSFRLLGKATAVLIVLLCASPTVRASCGDYLVTTHQRHSGTPHEQPHRCSGPNCSRAPLAPASPVPTVDRFSPEEWGLLDPPIHDSAPNGTTFFPDESSPCESRHGSGIFHPPRA